MARVLDFNFCYPKSMASFPDKRPYMEVEMASDFSDKTKIPVMWVFGFIAFFTLSIVGIGTGAVLYVTDLKMQIQIEHVRISNLESNSSQAVTDMKSSISEMRADLKDLIKGLEQHGIKGDK